jgi:hypothetical protein
MTGSYLSGRIGSTFLAMAASVLIEEQPRQTHGKQPAPGNNAGHEWPDAEIHQ